MKKSLLVALLATLLYALFLQFSPKPKELKLQSQWQSNRFILEKYMVASEASFVIYVGSSLTKRLDFNDDAPCVTNLSLDGESTLSGLAFVAKSPLIPKKVYAEINVPDRLVNQSLVDGASGVLPQLSAIFRTENIPTNLVFSYLWDLKSHNPYVSELNQAIVDSELIRHKRNYETKIKPALLEAQMNEYRRVVSSIEKKGSKVIFIEMPVHPSLENLARANQVRSEFKRVFPSNTFISGAELSNGASIKTVDGLHLSANEAKVVTLQLASTYADICPKRPV